MECERLILLLMFEYFYVSERGRELSGLVSGKWSLMEADWMLQVSSGWWITRTRWRLCMCFKCMKENGFQF